MTTFVERVVISLKFRWFFYVTGGVGRRFLLCF
jgi:hypothetical protein